MDQPITPTVVTTTTTTTDPEQMAHKLAEDKHLIATTPGRLADDLRALFAKPPALLPYPEADGTLFPRFLTGVLGLS